jgi:hypothetical protein
VLFGRYWEDTLGFLMMIGFTVVVGVWVSTLRIPVVLKRLAYAALVMRVFGAWFRYFILYAVYGGSGDARGYFGRGLTFAEYFSSLDFSPFYDRSLWFMGKWTGTSFMSYPSGIVLTFLGPSLLGEFVAFSLLSFLGLTGFVIAFRRACPEVPLQRYARWIWFFPSLWFWPASVGKESMMTLGIGLAVWGFFGKKERVNWPLLAFGTFLVFAIRPQVAAVVIFTFVLAYWVSLGREWNLKKTVQGAAILGVGLLGLYYSLDRFGVSGFDVEGVQEYLVDEAARASTGGSDVGRVEVGLAGIPMALVNILTRPWPWEAHNLMALISSMEMVVLWAMVWYRRKNVMQALRSWHSNPLVRVALPFVLIYAITLGMLTINLGIVARQRVLLFPFMFYLLEAAPAVSKRVAGKRPMRHAPRRAMPPGPVRQPAH